MPDEPTSPTAAAHRPSRRHEIIAAAILQFARKGFVDTSISDVAKQANVAVTAVYYHFSGKDELYGLAVRHVFEAISAIVTASRQRPDGSSRPDDEALHAAIDAVWNWLDTHPDEAALLYCQLPGATAQATAIRQEFEEQHAQAAFRYFTDGDGAAMATDSATTPQHRRAVETLMARTLIDLLVSVHTMRLADGPLAGESSDDLRVAVHKMAGHVVSS